MASGKLLSRPELAAVASLLVLATLVLFSAPHDLVQLSAVLISAGGEMLWLLLSWGIVAAVCYFAVTLMQGPSAQQVQHGQQQNKPAVNGDAGRSNAAKCEWTNEILAWMYENFHKVPSPLEAWIRALNDAAKKITSPAKCEVLFECFNSHSNVSQPPKITEIRAERGPREHMTIHAHVHLPCVKLRLVSSQRVADRLVVSNLDASIVDLRGEVECRVACIANQLYLMTCFNGRPEMDIELHNADPHAKEQVSFGLVEESLRRCLLSAVTNINLSEPYPEEPTHRRESPVDFRRLSALQSSFDRSFLPSTNVQFGDPDYQIGGYQNKTDRVREPSPNQVPEMFKKLNDCKLVSSPIHSAPVPNRLRVKVIKASRLGRRNYIDVQQPYVVVEMDEPVQRFQTSKGINANPYWEETHSFQLTPASDEILFEVYEGSSHVQTDDDKHFLGLSIVNLEEIRHGGEVIHVLPLQSRPNRKDDIHGDLTVQFELYYDPSISNPGKVVDVVRVTDPTGAEFKETVTTQRRPMYDPHDHMEATEITPTRTTTVLVKTVSQQLKERPNIQSVHGSLENAVDPATQRILEQQFNNDPKLQQLEARLQKAAEEQEKAPIIKDEQIPVGTIQNIQTRGRDRTKKNAPTEKRERSFFGELRDRLSGRHRSQKRSKSFDVGGPEVEEAVSLPPSRDPSRTRYATSESGPRYLETQSVGGRSGESTKSLYQHSTLVLELSENGDTKYFLIPPSMLNEPSTSKLLRKGKKLHIYNEHTFVAVKLRSGIACHVCQQRIKGSFSKQAYQCRDCRLVCHKYCHYKTDAFCTHSMVPKLHIAKDIDWAHFLSHSHLEEFISNEGL